MAGGAKNDFLTNQSCWLLRCIFLLSLPVGGLPFCASFLAAAAEGRHHHHRHSSSSASSITKLYSDNSRHRRDDDDDDDDDDIIIGDDHNTNGEQSSSFGLYVHIPYCRRRCNYCDFAIVPIGDAQKGNATRSARGSGFENMDSNYKGAVLDEIGVISKTTSPDNKIRLKSVYFGGGTPSLAPLSTLRDIMHALLESETAPFYFSDDDDDGRSDDAEITIEMDPGTFDMPYLLAVKEMGFNRISLGVQSFDDKLLATMGRVHRSADVYRSIDMIERAFGEEDSNYSIDLISGVPGLTLAGWADTLFKATQLHPRPKHMSLYDLQVEKGTAFGKWYGDSEDDEASNRLRRQSESSSSQPALPSVEDCAFMYSYASGYLRSKGYEHYEISSYAYRNEHGSHRSKHNQIYWQYTGGWYAIGLGATSNANGVRCARPRALSDYISWTEGLKQKYADYLPNDNAQGVRKPPWLYNDPETDDEITDDTDNLLDIVMTRLRTSEGLDLDWVAEQAEYGENCVSSILRGFELALELDLGVQDAGSNGKHGCIRLKDPKGFLFSNNIISNIFVELE